MSHDEIQLSHVNDCDRAPFNVSEFYERKAAWSREVFGPQQRVEGVIAHLRKELDELRAAIGAKSVVQIREELADICLLAIDLSWRAGGTAADFRGTSNCARIYPLDAVDYIGRHLDSTMPPAALAAVLWDIAFRALGCDGGPIEAKLAKIKTRKIPDWRTVPADQPIEHVREESWPDRIERVAAESMPIRHAAALIEGLEAQIAKLTAERDHLRASDEANIRERNHVRKLVDADPGETLIQAVRRYVERAKSAPRQAGGAGVKDMLWRIRCYVGARPQDRTDVAVAVHAGDFRRMRAGIREIVGADPDEDVVAAVKRWLDVVVEARSLISERDHLLAERAEWRADSERIRLERDDVRKILVAQPHETVTMAAQRVVNLSAARRSDIESLEGERDRIRAYSEAAKQGANSQIEKLTTERDRAFESLVSLAGALGADVTSPDATVARAITLASQLRANATAYGPLRYRLVELLGCPADFAPKDFADLIADRINGPITESEDDLLEQVQQLEGDVTALKAALHVATRAVQP